MSQPELPDEIIAGLLALYDACDCSTHARVQKTFWRRNFSSEYEKQANTIIKKCCSNPEGLVRRIPGRNMTYGITMAGVRALRRVRAIP